MNELEVAWAAGFFDGEGSTYIRARRGPNAPRGMFMWATTNIDDARTAIAVLWPYLSDPKRRQARRAFDWYDNFCWLREHTIASHCQRGHDFSDENTYVVPKLGTRRCRECDKQRKRRYQETSAG